MQVRATTFVLTPTTCSPRCIRFSERILRLRRRQTLRRRQILRRTPVAPVKNKTSKPAPSAQPVKQDDSGTASAPSGKSKSADSPSDKLKSENSADEPLKSADQTVVPVADSTLSASPQTSPVPFRVRMTNLKTAIDQRLSDAGLANRVHVTLNGGTLVLQGHLRPAEHQALLNKLRFLPDWAKVTDDILPVQ